jgi:hypothetical protein
VYLLFSRPSFRNLVLLRLELMCAALLAFIFDQDCPFGIDLHATAGGSESDDSHPRSHIVNSHSILGSFGMGCRQHPFTQNFAWVGR